LWCPRIIVLCPPILVHQLATRCLHSRKDGSSLEGQRSIANFFHMLDEIIKVDNAND